MAVKLSKMWAGSRNCPARYYTVSGSVGNIGLRRISDVEFTKKIAIGQGCNKNLPS